MKPATHRSDLDHLELVCTREQAEQLVRYDHHQAWVEGRQGILLMYHWMPLEAATEPLTLIITFHESARQHPPVPPAIQRLVDGLLVSKNKPVYREKHS
jgi:hypothetical protein